MNTESQRGAIGRGTLSQQQGNVTHNASVDRIVKNLQEMGDGTDFLVIQRGRQSEQPKVWSTGDSDQTKALLQQAYNTFGAQPVS